MGKTKQRLLLASIAALAIVLTACGGRPEEVSEEEQAAIQATQTAQASIISATGEVVPRTESTLSFNTAGTAIEIFVEEGDSVEQGEVIARLNTLILEAAVVQAEAGVVTAEANLEAARINFRDPEVSEAVANLRSSQADVDAAVAELEDVRQGATEQELIQAQIDVQQAYIQMLNDRAQWNYYRGIEDADYQNDGYDTIDFFLLPGGIEATRETYDLSLQTLELERAQLNEVADGPDTNELAALEADLRAAQASAAADSATVGERSLETLEQTIALREAQLEQQLVNLDASIIALEDAQIVAPFSGIVGNVYIQQGEYVSSGDPVIDIGDLSTLRVETTDLNEVDVALFNEGSPATVTFDAYPGIDVDAEVVAISPRSDEGTGVNYQVTLELDEIPAGVLWGMTAFVDIERDDG